LPEFFEGEEMTTSAFLSELAAVTAFVAAAFLVYVLAKALWAEIGPMICLLFRRTSQTASNEDDGIELKQ
jgi:hypothetical protein